MDGSGHAIYSRLWCEMMNADDRERRLADLAAWADQCQSEGRTLQALLVRSVILDILMGAPWLELMGGKRENNA